MKNHTDHFFSGVYNIGVDDYSKLVQRNKPGQFFRELYGHTIGYDGGAVTPAYKSSFFIEQGLDLLPNKTVRQVHTSKGVEVVYTDKDNDYFFNSDGFRSDYDFDGSEEIIFTGCSHTVGEGVPENMIWGSQVARSLGMKYANISKSGGSVAWCVDAIFGYLKKYKAKPKYIVALMPDFHRIVSVPNHLLATSYLSWSKDKVETENSVVVGNQWTWPHMTDVPDYIKKPYPMEITVTRETAVMQSLRAIHALEAYCEVAGIKFLWSTWAPDEEELFVNIKRDFPDLLGNYISVEARNWHSVKEHDFRNMYHKRAGGFGTNWSSFGDCKDEKSCSAISCHGELESVYGENFYTGTDRYGDRSTSHFGIHRHTHYAEKFIEEIAKLG